MQYFADLLTEPAYAGGFLREALLSQCNVASSPANSGSCLCSWTLRLVSRHLAEPSLVSVGMLAGRLPVVQGAAAAPDLGGDQAAV